jgi:hypothetical protein
MQRQSKRLYGRIFLILAALAVVAGVILSKEMGGTERNLIVNPGFEEGDKGWQWLQWSKGWAPFQISRSKARSGSSSALLPVRSEGESRSTIVWGVVQELSVGEDTIDCLEGHYYVDDWERGAANQYIQTVIIDLSKKLDNGNAQVRYILSGMDRPPYNLGNAHYVFVDPGKKKVPTQKKWVLFTINPASDFKRLWGYEPVKGHRLRVLFEARFDNHMKMDRQAAADVYYDDLYLGPATSRRCGK